MVNKNSRLIFDDNQFVKLAISHFGGAAQILDKYGSVVHCQLQGLTKGQATGLAYLSLSKIVPFYLNLPNTSGASFFGMDDASALNFVNRFPTCLEAFNCTMAIKAELAQWNPTFTEAALFVSNVFFQSYTGKNYQMKKHQREMLNARNLILWKMSKGNVEWYERRISLFDRLFGLLNGNQNGMLTAIENTAQNDFVMSNLSTTMAQAVSHAEMLIESVGEMEGAAQ